MQSKELKDWQDYAADQEKSYQRLIDTHGQGVRPSWVSTDLALLGADIRYANEKVAELKSKGDQE